ncbi:MAG: M14 family zinc carboxypeptidase [Longimicrobiales bacterium]|nr:M14 family zinc carboxypeptidase [Longimicrobiales bacterium]
MKFRIRAVTAIALFALPSVTLGQGIPTPESVLGHEVGADFVLATYEESMAYFAALDAASDRVMMRDVGTTSFGRTARIALISSAENLRNLDRHIEIAHRLANPIGLSDDEARALAREGRAIVHIDGGMHATEVAHAQHTIQLAHDLVTGDDDPEIAAVLDNVILLLWPSINPDGQTLIAEWYNGNVGTRYEVAPAPFLYQKYIGHDNNRDGYMINMIESRFITRVAREYEPQILYNHHQTSPFPTRIWIPPFAEPISPRVHPLMWRTVNLMGMNMSHALEERGMRGATHMGSGFDNWYPGFMDHAQNFHNIASFLTETALYRFATPQFYTVGDFPSRDRELRPGSLYSSPWEGGWWRIGDAVDYMLVASFSVLDFAAKFREDVLYNRYQAGRDAVATYTEAPPYAWFVPQDQRDPVAAVELLRRLAFNGVEVQTTTEAITVDGLAWPAGTWVIRMDQPFANFVAQLFDVQEYPDLRQYPEGPPDQPYDVAGWTLPWQMGVEVHEVRTPLAEYAEGLEPVVGVAKPWDFEGDASPFDSPPDVGFDTHPVAAGIVPPPGRIEGGGGALLLDAAQNNSFKAISRALASGARVRFVPGETSEVEGDPGTTGAWAIEGLSGDQRAGLVGDLHLQARAGGASGPEVTPRIGLYRPWNPSMDEGWTRWVLEAYEVPFTSLYNPDVRAGDLIDRYDVIVIADIGTRTIVEGWSEAEVPGRYAGGIGAAGVRELDDFVRAGGTLVTINGSSHFAIDRLHLPVSDVVRDLDNEEFSLSGSVVQLMTDPSHPVMTGMTPRAAIMVGGSPVFTTEEGFKGRILARYAAEGSPLMSGYLLGEEHLQGYAAAVDVRHGEGRVVLLGMRPQWRAQPFGSFRILFNAAMYTKAVADAVPGESLFWEAPATDEGETSEEEEGRGSPF